MSQKDNPFFQMGYLFAKTNSEQSATTGGTLDIPDTVDLAATDKPEYK